MKTWTDLSTFARSLTGEDIASVYVAYDGADDRERWAWRKRLAAAASGARPDSTEAAEHFDAAIKLVEAELEPKGRMLPCPGWVVFAGPEEVHYSGGLLHRPTEAVTWGSGALLGAYLPSLTAHQQMVVVLLDQRRARLLTYRGGDVTEVKEITADSAQYDAVGAGVGKRASRATGVRGSTRTDAARRAQAPALAAFASEVAEAAVDLLGVDGVGIAVGGPPDASNVFRQQVRGDAAERLVDISGVTVRDEASALPSKVDDAFLHLRQQWLGRLLDSVLESSSGEGVGWNSVARALAKSSVDLLLISSEALESAPDQVEAALRGAIEGGSAVELVTGESGSRLMAEAEGFAARLRFT